MNATAVLPPTVKTTPVPASAESASPAESLGWQLRGALPPLRLHSVSLYDRDANVLWLSEGALGPDEHNLVVEAVEALATDITQTCYELGMEDGRCAIFLPVRAPRGDLVGLAMILADIKSIGDGVLERLVTPQVRTIMQKIAVLLRTAAVKSGATQTVPVLDVSLEPVAGISTGIVAVATGGTAVAPNPARQSPPVPSDLLSANAVADILEFEPSPEVARPRIDSPGALSVPTLAAPPVAPESETQEIFVLSLDSGPASAAATSAPAAGFTQIESPTAARTPTPAEVAPTVAVTVRLAPTATLAGEGTAPVMGAAPAPMAPLTAMTAPGSQLVGGHTDSLRPLPSGHATGTSRVLALEAAAALPAPGNTGTSRSVPSGATVDSGRVLPGSDSPGILLEVLPYTKLRTGGRSRRYEILVRRSHRDAAAVDAHTVQRLLAWLSAHRGAWNLEPTTFTLNLSIATLEDERFLHNLAATLNSQGISPETLGFEIAEALCVQRRAQVERFMNQCDKMGCFVVIDDFSFDSSILSLLRSKALRLVKIDPKLTGVALKDKLAQALVVAIAQAVKVVGIHCSAKSVESASALQWLTAIGCDFAQGPAAAPLQPLDALAGLPPA